jgi:hypothetical protein
VVYQQLVEELCPNEPPTFDLFASFLTAKTAAYASLQPDPRATWIDCMVQPWALHPHDTWYAFPPPNQLVKFLNKLEEEKQTALLVALAWPHLHANRIARMLIKAPVVFPFSNHTVVDPHWDLRPKYQRQVRERWIMAGYLVSDVTASITASRESLLSDMSPSSAARRALPWRHQWDGSQNAKAMEWIQHLRHMIDC